MLTLMDNKTFLFIWTYFKGYNEVFEYGRSMPCLQITANTLILYNGIEWERVQENEQVNHTR